MNAVPTVALLLLLAVGTDQQGVLQFHSEPFSAPTLGSASLERTSQQSGNPDASSQDASPAQPPRSSEPLKPESRILLIRYVDGEFAKLVQSLPAGKQGFKILAGKPLNKQKLSDALRLYGTAASQGDTVQITGLEFRSQEVILQINGGGKKHFNWRQHVQVGVGNVGTPPPETSAPAQVAGGTLILDYGRSVPDMSAEDLKSDLSTFLDFSKQHSAAVNWIDTLPSQFQDAIKDHRAVVGMDQEMVIAAMGRPEHKVREKSPEGNETEDWIYGSPPARTTFVTFAGDTVIRVKEFN
ncbi:MAG TPA: hypothetical protein VEJ45_00015 [Candidatus Acidoferrales bacterium]|nr:hypothetical protein [Candidatus Acidoferrales bacterium]